MTEQPEDGAGEPMSERMQALLSRAVEDQVSEQRQMQGLLAELRTLLGRLPNEVSAAVAERGTDEAIRVRIDELASHLAQLGQHIAGLARAVDTRAPDDTGSMVVVNAVQASTETLLARIENLTQGLQVIGARVSEPPPPARPDPEVAARVKAIETRLEEVSAAVNDTHRRVIGLDNALGDLPEDVRAVGERIDSRVGSRLDQLDEIAAALTELRGAQPGDPGLGAELAAVRSAVDELAARPTLAEDRETVVLAIRQLLGETVRAAMSDSERHLREHVDEAVRAALESSEERMLGQAAQGFRAASSEGERALQQSIEETVKALTAESEQRLMDHVDTAIITLAEALVRRRPRGGDAVASTPEAVTPVAGTPQPTYIPQSASPAPLPELESIEDMEVEVEEPPVGGEAAPSGEGKRRRGWFRHSD